MTSTWMTLGTASSGQTTYTDTTPAEAHTYYYRVAGSNSSGTGDYSTGLSVLTVPAAPTGLTATPISTTEVDLAWSNNSNGASGYDVYRAAGAGGYSRIAHALASNASSYNDTTTSAGVSYSYQVFAYNATGPSSPATAAALTAPAAPQSFAAIASSASEIDLSWNQVGQRYAVHRSERSPDGTDQWVQIAQVDSSTLGAQDTDLESGTTYYYSVTASNATGDSDAATTNAANPARARHEPERQRFICHRGSSQLGG